MKNFVFCLFFFGLAACQGKHNSNEPSVEPPAHVATFQRHSTASPIERVAIRESRAPTPSDLPRAPLSMTVGGRQNLAASIAEDVADQIPTGDLLASINPRSLRVVLRPNGKFRLEFALAADSHADSIVLELEVDSGGQIYSAFLPHLHLNVEVRCILQQQGHFCDPRENSILNFERSESGQDAPIEARLRYFYQTAAVHGALQGHIVSDFASPVVGHLYAVELISAAGLEKPFLTLETKSQHGTLIFENRLSDHPESLIWDLNRELSTDPNLRKISVSPTDKNSLLPLRSRSLYIGIDNAPWPRIWLTLSQNRLDLELERE